MRAGFFKLLRPADVRFFIEACLQLDQHGDLFARARRGRQRLHDRRIAGHAIQRLLDREHLWVAGSRLHKLYNRIKTLIRMVQEVLILPQLPERVFAPLPRRRGDLIELLIHEFRFGQPPGNAEQHLQVKRPVNLRCISIGQFQ
jgi:hypothetical protein